MRFQEAACHIAPGCAFDDCKDPEPKLPDTQDGLATRAKDQSLEASSLFQWTLGNHMSHWGLRLCSMSIDYCEDSEPKLLDTQVVAVKDLLVVFVRSVRL